jgi:hypothetical protein
LLDHGGWDWVKTHAAGIPWPIRSKQIAIGCAGPWQQLATAQLGLAPPSHALSNQGALVFSDGRADLSQQLIRRIITHGPLDKLDATATLAEFIDQEHLMDVVARSTIRSGAQHTGKGGHGCPVSEAIETGALEGGAAIAVITVDVLVGHIPIGGRRNVSVETTELLFNRLVLVLTRR